MCASQISCDRRRVNLESLKQVLVEAVDSFPMDVIHTDDLHSLRDFGTVLGQMVAILNNFLFVCSSLY